MSHRKNHNNKNYVARAPIVKPDKETLQNEALLVYTLKTDSDDALLKSSEEFCYLVSEKWWDTYEVYLGYNEIIEEKPLKKSFGQKHPGPVNEDIVGDQEKAYKFPPNFEQYEYLATYIRPKVLENESYILVDSKLWEHIYGLYGGKTIKRPLRHDYSTPSCDDLQKFHIVILTHSRIKELASDPKTKTQKLTSILGGFRNIQFHQTWKMKDLLNFLNYLLEVETGTPVWNLKVWRLNNYMYLDDFWKSMEDFLNLFPEQNKYLIEAKELTNERFESLNLSKFIKEEYYLVIEAKEDDNEEFYFDECKLTSQNIKELQGYCEYCNEKEGYLTFTCLCQEVFYCSERCKYKDVGFHYNICSSAYDSESDEENEIAGEIEYCYDRGLKNLGNTCYMNSVLQAFKQTSVPEKLFFNNNYVKCLKEKKEENKQGEEEDNKFLLSKKFSKMIKKLSIFDKEPLAPWSMKQVFGLYFPNFKGYHQHDSQEFMAYLINGLHDELSINLDKGNDIPKQIDYSNPEEYLNSSLKSSFSVFSELFQGLFSSEIKCPTCGHTSTQYDQFNMVSLPLYCKEDHFNIVITYIAKDITKFFETKTYKFSSNFNQNLGDMLDLLRKDLNLSNDIPLYSAIVDDDTIEEILSDTTILLKDLKGKLELKRKKLVAYEMPVDWDPTLDHVFQICFSTEIVKPNTGISFKKRVGVPRLIAVKPNPSYEDIYVNIMEFLKDEYPELIPEFLNVKEKIQKFSENAIELEAKNGDKKDEETNVKKETSIIKNEASSKKEAVENNSSVKKNDLEEKKTAESTIITETSTSEIPKPQTGKKGKKGGPRVSKRKKPNVNNNVVDTPPAVKEDKKKESKSPIKEENQESEKLDPETLLQDFVLSLPYYIKFENKMKNIQACVLCNKKTCHSCSFTMTHSNPLSSVLEQCQTHQLQVELNLFFPKEIPKILEQNVDDPLVNNTVVSTGNANPSLLQCIELFSEKEVLSNENMWFCPLCDEKKQAEKTIRMFYVSKYLIFHLKRFKSVEGSGNSKSNKKVKNTQPIDYPIDELDLTPYVKSVVPHLKDEKPKELKFKLTAVVLHEGKLDEGHYTALGRCRDGMWKKFDDEKVQEINEKDVCHKNAYLLFYELI